MLSRSGRRARALSRRGHRSDGILQPGSERMMPQAADWNAPAGRARCSLGACCSANANQRYSLFATWAEGIAEEKF